MPVGVLGFLEFLFGLFLCQSFFFFRLCFFGFLGLDAAFFFFLGPAFCLLLFELGFHFGLAFYKELPCPVVHGIVRNGSVLVFEVVAGFFFDVFDAAFQLVFVELLFEFRVTGDSMNWNNDKAISHLNRDITVKFMRCK